MPKSGWKTSEFAVTVLTAVAALLAAVAGQLAPRWAAIAAAVSVGLYAVSRGLAKVPTPPVAPTTVNTAPPPTQ